MKDGRWKFEEVGIAFHAGTTGNFIGFVDVEDGEVATIWLITNETGDAHPIAQGSYLYRNLLPQIIRDLPAMIDWQSGGRANLTAHSRAETREATS